jgi:precorrin-6A synthase
VRTILVIGIGAGEPEHLTVQAIAALNRTDVFFMVDKGEATADLVRVRRAICERYAPYEGYRFVEIEDPARDRGAAGYVEAVKDWHGRRADAYERAFLRELRDGECGAFLVWGDPSLYDSTLRVVEEVSLRRNVALQVDVCPGISSPQALAARHRIVLHDIGAPVLVTTGRRLRAEGLPPLVEQGGSVVVMLDGEGAFEDFAGRADLEIVWGAMLGLPSEILIRGSLKEVAGAVAEARCAVKQRSGWIMDVYLLRKLGQS